MSDDADLMRAVLADPEDDLVRLVYADYLEETGQAERAEFIRLQIRMSRLAPYSPEFPALRRRERELIVANGRTWRSGLPTIRGLTWGPFHRGFIHGVEVRHWDDFVAAGEPIFEIQPIRTLEINRMPLLVLTQMSEAPALARIHGLNISMQHLDETELERLFHSEYVTSLRHLSLHGVSMTNQAGVSLFGSMNLMNLREIIVSGNDLTVKSLRRLRLERRANLQRLNLAYNKIHLEGITEVMNAPGLNLLQSLVLRGCELRNASIQVFIQSSRSRQLRYVDLSTNDLGDEWGAGLCEAQPFHQIELLDLRYNFFSLEMIGRILSCYGERVVL